MFVLCGAPRTSLMRVANDGDPRRVSGPESSTHLLGRAKRLEFDFEKQIGPSQAQVETVNVFM